jgi:hypothetical protein
MFRFESVSQSVHHTKQTAGTVQCKDMSVLHSTVVVFSVWVSCAFVRAEEVNIPATVLRSVASLVCLSYIQGDSGGICTTLGDDSMSDSKQKSSYEHGSDF